MRKYFLFLDMLVLVIILSVGVKPVLKVSSKCFWNIVSVQFDKEENERQKRIENGEIVRGKDTILIWKDKYVIGHYYDCNQLEIYNDGMCEEILEKVTKHKVVKKKLYVVSDEGVAVIDKDNLCRVYVFDEGYINKYADNERIEYVSSINDFSEEEQKVISKM